MTASASDQVYYPKQKAKITSSARAAPAMGAMQAPVPQLTISAPAANSRVASSRLRLQVAAVKSDGNAEVELSPVTPTPGQAATWRAPLSQLVAGALVPTQLVGSRTGRWQLRARLVEPKAGPWSAPVVVELVASVVVPATKFRATDGILVTPAR